MRSLALGLTAVLVFGGPTHAQNQDFSTVDIESTDLGSGVYMLTGRGGNIGLSVGRDGAFLVDDQFAPLTEKIAAAVAAISDAPVRFVLNTHYHGDHTGGNENFGKAGAMIVAHRNVRKRMNPEEFRDVIGSSRQEAADALPVITFTEEADFYWNGQRIRAIHVPHAHTDGDAVIVFGRANVVHMGDTFFNGRYPYIDMNAGGSVDGVIHAAEVVLDVADASTRIIPGHGPVSTPADLRAYRDMLVTVRDRVRELVNGGASEDEVVAAAPTADLDETWGENSERFVRAVYQSIAK